MKIVRIFENTNDLLAIKYENSDIDVLEQLFKSWTDIEFIEDFFNTNISDLNTNYWNNISVEEAIFSLLEESGRLIKMFNELNNISYIERQSKLKVMFRPLDNNLSNKYEFDRTKVYGGRPRNFLRIYALKIDEEKYIITGGTIKLTKKMQDRENSNIELKNLEKCKDFLYNNGIVDKDGLDEYLEIECYED
ncbi:hypothetical protein E0494_05240 [Marinilabiliaceae bacterium JC040]|nr:hypothetical protein [Marinilabiliaceae bacterium JC040]